MSDRTTLVQRLRNTTFLQVSHPHFAPIAEAAHEAADELDRLNAQTLALCAEISGLRRDALRYRWLRKRMEVRNHEAVSGSIRPGLDVRIGCTFLDSPLPISSNPAYWEGKAVELDAAIDAFLAAKEGER